MKDRSTTMLGPMDAIYQVADERLESFDTLVKKYFPFYMEPLMRRDADTGLPCTYFALLSVDDEVLALHTSDVPADVILTQLTNNPGSRFIHVRNLDDLFQEMYR